MQVRKTGRRAGRVAEVVGLYPDRRCAEYLKNTDRRSYVDWPSMHVWRIARRVESVGNVVGLCLD